MTPEEWDVHWHRIRHVYIYYYGDSEEEAAEMALESTTDQYGARPGGGTPVQFGPRPTEEGS